MSTNPLERIPKRSPKTSVTDLNEFAMTAGSTAASAAYPIMLGLTGEDTGDEWYEDLAYGAVPGGALVQRAKTGTMPGLLDLLPGELGAGAKLAMLPIAKFGVKEILEGTARMGKSARNTEKALTKEAGDSPYVFYHRTKADHVDDIKREGINRNSRNKGENTWDSDELPDVNWLSPSPSNIPVLRWPLRNEPETVAQFKVTLPRDFYDNAINNSTNPTKTLEFLLNSENIGDVVENMLTTTNYGHIGRVPYTADARRDGLQGMYKRTLPGIYNVSYRESINNGATDAEAREYALGAVKYWMKERIAEGASQGHISVGDLIEP